MKRLSMYNQRLLWALMALIVLEIVSVFFWVSMAPVPFREMEGVAASYPRISDLHGAPSLGGPAIMVSNEGGFITELPLCSSLPAAGFMLLLLGYVLLLAFNLAASYKSKGVVGGPFEIVLTGLFIILWAYFDECLTAAWFPLAVLKLGLLVFIVYLVLYGEE